MGIFSPADAPCGIFSPSECANPLQHSISFVRTANKLRPIRAPQQTSGGEVLLSFTPIGPYSIEMQSKTAGFNRLLGGQVVEIAWLGIAAGNPDLLVGDRCYFDGGKQLEVINTSPWGTHLEIEFREIGR